MTGGSAADRDEYLIASLSTYRPLRRLKTVVTAGLLAYVAAVLIASAFDVLDWMLTTDILRGKADTEERERRLDRQLEVVGHAFMAVYVPTGIIFLTTLYRLAANARALTGGDAVRAPATAVIWFFVPVLNLFMPYLSVQ